MIGSDYRRVRTVRLKGPDAPSVLRGRIILENAMRTATLPDAWGSRLVLVRSMDVGSLDCSRSPVGIAHDLSEMMHLVSAGAVHGDETSAPGSRAVFFRDEIEPYRSLITCLARGQPTDAWFWPLAAPAWSLSMDRPEAMRTLLFAAAQTRPGAVAVMQIIGHLRRHRLLDPMLGSLRPCDGPRLLEVFGWTPSSATSSRNRNAPDDLAAPALSLWRTTLESWVPVWGIRDQRSHWLAAVTLVERRPQRLEDPRIMSLAEQVLGTYGVTSQQDAVAQSPIDGDADSLQAAREVLPSDIVVASSDPAASVLPYDPKTESSQTIPAASVPERDAPVGETHRSENVAPRRPGTIRSQIDPLIHSTDPDSIRPDGQEIVVRRGSHESDVLQTPVAPDRPGAVRTQHDSLAPTIDPEYNNEAAPALPWPDAPSRTTLGGLFFLVPVLDRLGVGEYLREHPQLIDCDLPARLLTGLARRLGATVDDPVIQAIGFDECAAIDFNTEFIVPRLWTREIIRGDTFHLYKSELHKRRRILTDSSNRLTLACYSGPAGPDLRQLIDGGKVERAAHSRNESSGDLLLRTWLLALRRWCRRRAHMGLGTIVCREGFVRSTPTHIDVFFRLSQADIRVRRAGLDIDPGWVSWLGRVVSFHYVDGDQLNGH